MKLQQFLKLARSVLAVGLICTGVAMIYVPAAFIVAGLLVLLDVATDR